MHAYIACVIDRMIFACVVSLFAPPFFTIINSSIRLEQHPIPSDSTNAYRIAFFSNCKGLE